MTRLTSRSRWPARVYYTLVSALGLVAAWVGAVAAQVTLTVTPAMVKGRSDAPVTIVEFSDYQ